MIYKLPRDKYILRVSKIFKDCILYNLQEDAASLKVANAKLEAELKTKESEVKRFILYIILTLGV